MYFSSKTFSWRRSAGGILIFGTTELRPGWTSGFRTQGLRGFTRNGTAFLFFAFFNCGCNDSYTGPVTSSGCLFSYLVGLFCCKNKTILRQDYFHLHQEPGLGWIFSAHGFLPKTKKPHLAPRRFHVCGWYGSPLCGVLLAISVLRFKIARPFAKTAALWSGEIITILSFSLQLTWRVVIQWLTVGFLAKGLHGRNIETSQSI